jgi:hypothetical protein
VNKKRLVSIEKEKKRQIKKPFFGDEGGVSIAEDVVGLAVTLELPVLFDLLSNFLRSLADCLCSRSFW